MEPTTRTYAPHQARVLDERSELEARLAKLSEFLANPESYGLAGHDEFQRLKLQRGVMQTYLDILDLRIEEF